MKKKTIIIGSLVILLLVIGIILLLSKKEEVTDENILYSVNFNNVVLRFKHVDNVIGQNQIVTVEKSIDNGKTFDVITEEGLTVSLEPKFIFLNEQLGFAVKKSNNTKENGKYYGMYVTVDGGKSFTLSEINYDNPTIEVLTITYVPYFDNEKLVLPCSIYQVKEDLSGYEDVVIYFVSTDNGLTWNIDESIKESDIVNKINVTINGTKYEANLENNETVKEFIKLLPNEFNMNELNGNEKYIYLDNNLPSNPVNVKHINKGDIMLYGDNCLVIFYKSFDTSYFYTKIGHIANLPDLDKDSILVKIEK
ncbi:MAG: hypothetical protein J6X02_02690 [Bacilli bacterium]|nr:hypothetical protein [Bacilli bacterium]